VKEEIQNLIEIVDEEVKEFREFLGSLTCQAEHLTAGDFSSFEKSVISQEGASERLSMLERERQEVTSSLAEKLNLEPRGLDLATVAQLVEVSQSTRLRELYGTLLNLFLKIEEARATNELLIQESVKLMQNTLSEPDRCHLPDPAESTALNPQYQVAGMMN
jgi:hypothetical protein